MVRFTIRLADLPIGMTVQYPQTAEKYRSYFTEQSPIFSVVNTSQVIARERSLVSQLAAMDARSFGHLSAEESLDDQAAYHQVAECLPEFDAMLIHGSAIALDGQAYLFMAPSGTGKSTHARLWREHFGSRAVMVNDDKPMLRFREDGIWICGTPWQGKHDLGSNITVPLRAACVLTRSPNNHVEPLSPAEAFPALLRQSYRFEQAVHAEQMLRLNERLMGSVPLFRLGCNMDPEAARICYEGMQKYLRRDDS